VCLPGRFYTADSLKSPSCYGATISERVKSRASRNKGTESTLRLMECNSILTAAWGGGVQNGMAATRQREGKLS